MDIRALILKTIKRKGAIRARETVTATGFSRAYVNRFFRALVEEGKIALIGKANTARYVSVDARGFGMAKSAVHEIHRMLRNHNLSEDAVLEAVRQTTGIFVGLSRNVSDIMAYAFVEMLNNAIEHSSSQTIEIRMRRSASALDFSVSDKGVGVFRNIMKKRRLHSEMAAIQDLLKGKQTTAPRMHTGEGIFFTSKIADHLVIKSFTKRLIFDNFVKDVFIEDGPLFQGTLVRFKIALSSRTQLRRVFREYAGQAFEFSKTRVAVRLYKADAVYLSRSQARRVMSGLDKFTTVFLDFTNVRTVGQAFADEVFRVWQVRHPRIRILPQNMNSNVAFMVKRAGQA